MSTTSRKHQNPIDPRKYYESNPTRFIPKLYNFKIPKDSNISEVAIANSPPFWVLVDHLVGVVWKLYSKEKDGRKLGILQLHWALEFIKMIKDNGGKLTKTLESVKNSIEDALILKYANLPLDNNNLNGGEYGLEGGQEDLNGIFEGISQTSKSASFTLKDILSRPPKSSEKPLPSAGLPLDGTKLESRPCNANAQIIPANAETTVKSQDMLRYLKFLKKLQFNRLIKEKKELERIEDAINQVEAGQFDVDYWVKKNEEN